MEKISAPFDEKNLTTDYITDLFDDSRAIDNGKDYLGFINNEPCQIRVNSNSLPVMRPWKFQDSIVAEVYKRAQEIAKQAMEYSDNKIHIEQQGNGFWFYFLVED